MMQLASIVSTGPVLSDDPAAVPAYEVETRPRIAIIDDESINIKVLRKHLQMAGYSNFVSTTVAADALPLLNREKVDVVLMDVMMPEVSGLEILAALRNCAEHRHIPVIILTAATDAETRRQALEAGATDFLTKPVDVNELIVRVRNALLLKAHHDVLEQSAEQLRQAVAMQTAELRRTRREVVHCLARASEYRDNETGKHVLRVGRYAGVIARALRADPEWVELIELAAPLHDVGKIAVPDELLRKPGKLEPEEFELMQKHAGLGRRIFEKMNDAEYKQLCHHADVGAEILGGGQSKLLEMAARIALTHHERWDGTGYPLALSGTNIPLEGRITAVADVFDALSTKRPYKPAYPVERCVEMMREQRGKQFDPAVLDAFLGCLDQIVAIQIDYADYE